jgi:ERI1 exoribonuclease 2
MPSPFDHIVVLDFEATCNNGPPPAPQEIIEFPSVLLSLADHAVVDEFSSFVRPVHHPQLTDFCRELTGIEQADVDAAPAFLDVLAAHQSWLASHHLETSCSSAPATGTS